MRVLYSDLVKLVQTGRANCGIFLPSFVMSPAKSQKGMKALGERESVSGSRMCTGWLIRVCASFVSKTKRLMVGIDID